MRFTTKKTLKKYHQKIKGLYLFTLKATYASIIFCLILELATIV